MSRAQPPCPLVQLVVLNFILSPCLASAAVLGFPPIRAVLQWISLSGGRQTVWLA